MDVCEGIKKPIPMFIPLYHQPIEPQMKLHLEFFIMKPPLQPILTIIFNGNNPPLKLVLNHLLLIKVHFDEFESKLKVNEGIRVEVMKFLQAMNEKMFWLVKVHDLNLTTSPHKSSHAFLKIKMYYV